jgi:hypothetical protein
MNVEEAVGMKLSPCRRKKRISQERLGFDAGVHRTYVSLIDSGAKAIPETTYGYHGAPTAWPRELLPLSTRLGWPWRSVFQG